MRRCGWVPLNDQKYIEYHDREWGVPVHDDRKLFEFLVLEGAQAGLSWRTILQRRENYRKAFDQFDPSIVSEYGEDDIERLLNDTGIIRNRLKVRSAVQNARSFLTVREEFGSFDSYIWDFVGKKPVIGGWAEIWEIPASTELSTRLSRDLKRRGFKFVGTTICYSFMQAVGLVNDHTTYCFRYSEIAGDSNA